MYKLTVVAGPNRGTSYALQEGETSIGRQTGNAVMLQSAKVSKRHCVLVVSNGEIVMRDQGSSNGTFVNGVLSKEKQLKPGDRISVGDYVFQIIRPSARPSAALPANVLPFPVQLEGRAGGNAQGAGALTGAMPGSLTGSMRSANDQGPKSLKDKVIHFFENKIMPYFYGMNLRYQWKFIVIGLFAAFAIANLFISISPLLDAGREAVIKESSRRASFMAKQIADRNTAVMAQHAETRTEIGGAEQGEGVSVAVLMDLENRIIAPAARMNQYLTTGPEALFAIKARDLYRSGRESGIVSVLNDDLVAAIEPIKVLNSAKGRNEVVAVALVSVDTSLATPGLSDLGMIYSKTLIATGILGALVLLILYRVTLKPLLVLGDDMDKVLKGDMPQVTHEFKVDELNPLWDLINSALQRVPKGNGGGINMSGAADSAPQADDFMAPLKMLGSIGKFGLVFCDGNKKVVHLNPVFEEMSGIRADGAIGQDLPTLARDQAFGAMATDILERSLPGNEGVTDEFEFSGVAHKMYGAAFGPNGGAAWGYVLVAVRSVEE